MKYLLDKDQKQFRDVLTYIELNKDNRKSDKTKEPKKLQALYHKHDLDMNIIALELNGIKTTYKELIENNLKNHDLEYVFEIQKIELQDDYYKLIAIAYYSDFQFLSYLEKRKDFETLNNLGRKIILDKLKIDDRDIAICYDGVYELTRGKNMYDAHLIGDVISEKLVMSIKEFTSLLEYVKNDYYNKQKHE